MSIIVHGGMSQSMVDTHHMRNRVTHTLRAPIRDTDPHPTRHWSATHTTKAYQSRASVFSTYFCSLSYHIHLLNPDPVSLLRTN